jgi:hypothetical protein
MRTAPLLLLLLATTSAHAATYYVSPSGSDSTSCNVAASPSSPRQTINAGAACLAPGDTLQIKDGTYPEYLSNVIPSGRDADHPTTIRAEHPRQVIMNQVQPSWAPIITLGEPGNPTPSRYVTIEGIVFDIPLDRASGALTAYGGTDTDGPHHITILNNEVRGGFNSGNVSQFTTGMGQGGNGHHWTIIGNDFHDIGMERATPDQAAWSYGLYISGSDNIIAGNTFRRISAYGIHGYSTSDHLHRNLICNNTFENLGGPAMLICGSDNRIMNNVIHGTGLGPANGSYRGGINLALSCYGVPANGNQILNNTISGVAGSGQEGCIALSLPGRGNANGNVVKGNVCYQNADDIISNQVGSNTVEGNHCQGAGCSTDGGPQFATAAATDGSCPAGPPSAKPKLPTPKRLHRVSQP